MSATALEITTPLLQELGRTKARIDHAIENAKSSGEDNYLIELLLHRRRQVNAAYAAFMRTK